MAGARVQLLQDFPVSHLTGFRHGQELEAVQGVGVLVEVDLEHLGALALGRPRLLENGRLLALERACKVGAAALRLGGFLAIFSSAATSSRPLPLRA